MINTLNSVSASSKGLGHDLSPLTQQIAKRADANGDGTVSAAEFSLFMNELLAKLDAPSQPADASRPSLPVPNDATSVPSSVAASLSGAVVLRAPQKVGK